MESGLEISQFVKVSQSLYCCLSVCLSIIKITFAPYAVVDCGELDDPDNGQVSLDETTFESIATYTCDPGFILTGNTVRICQENGNWSDSEPTCDGHLTITLLK